MENTTERAIGHLFGLLGGLLILVGGVFAVAAGFVDLALGRVIGAAGALGGAVVLFVVGALVLFFAHMGENGWKDRPVTTGVLLVVLAAVGWAALGLGANLLALVGGIFALVAGVLYLIEPAQHAVTKIATSS
ncbi:MAG TPA: hypothetical protein VMD28_07920 [Acidimicrobiales bacterium]|jgi:hypothetical protein|nr:hypothetical protein [Acidimicrobiales bacterium]